MKRIVLVFGLLVMPCVAKNVVISPLPLPKIEVVNLETQNCSKRCLNKLYEEGDYISFIARFGDEEDVELRAKLSIAMQEIGILEMPIPPQKNNVAGVKIALLMPKKVIGRYFTASIDTILSYLMVRGGDFSFEVFNTNTEDSKAIQEAYDRAVAGENNFIIGIFTANGAKHIAQDLDISTPIYLPTINARQIQNVKIPKNLYFGGIDYEKQIEILLSLSGGEQIVVYNDKSQTGSYLGSLLHAKNARIVFEQAIDGKDAKAFNKLIASQKGYLKSSVAIFNTPGVRTGLMISIMGSSGARPRRMLSTQVNYDPSLLSLIQPSDRKELFVVNVINQVNPYLLEYAALLGRDLKYNWVNYATAVGVELLLGEVVDKKSRYFNERFLNNQVDYKNKVYKISGDSFYEWR